MEDYPISFLSCPQSNSIDGPVPDHHPELTLLSVKVDDEEKARRFHIQDLENDEVLDKWIDFINEGTDLQGDDDTYGDSTFSDK